ncbi:MAG: hypothetical protein MJA82_03800 [Clostridia bacterium]|nr:hypothetical protein [Clostridia bacterium]
MKKTEFLGIARKKGSATIANLVFLLLKNNGFKVGLINDSLIKVNERVVKKGRIDYGDIEKILVDEEDLDYMILDNLEIKELYELVKIHTIEAVIDDSMIEDENSIERKKLLFDNLKKNGISIINSDDKVLSNYFDCLRDKIIVTYGFNAKSTITSSSLDINEDVALNCCIQRGITTSRGNEIEQMEFPIKIRYYDDFNISYFLAAIALALIYEIPVANIQETIYKLGENDLL